MAYLERIYDGLLLDKLDTIGAVLVEGPKWCGKTTTARRHCKSYMELQDVAIRQNLDRKFALNPSLVLQGEVPRLFDEWQMLPILWDAVRQEVDRRQAVGQFVLTGSNSVKHSEIMHSGAGRIASMTMWPMSLFESEESSGEISLRRMFDEPGCDIDCWPRTLTIEQLVFAACRGGWPAAVVAQTDRAKLGVVDNFYESITSVDVQTLDGVERNPTLARHILRTWARNVSTLAKGQALLKDVQLAMDGCSDKTFYHYAAAFRRLFIITDVEPWSPAIRSATAIRRGPKRELCDPSIAVAALSLSPERLLDDLRTFGFIFETMAMRDLRVYSQALGGQLSYYHDRYDLEADAVLHLRDGRYALIEFKLGGKEIDKGAEHLLRIKSLVEQAGGGQLVLPPPTLMMVITAGNVAYTRPDGVKVVPLAALRD